MDKLERIIKKSLIEQNTFAKAIKMAKEFTNPQLTGPMAHLYAGAGKTVPALSAFSKEVQKEKGAGAQYNPDEYNAAYDSSAQGTWIEMDYATMNKQVGVSIDIAPMWSNQAAYNELIRLGGRPFLATKGQTQVPWAAITKKNIETVIKKGNKLLGGTHRGIQVVMYNHPDHQVGMIVYFFENPDKMVFPHQMYNGWKYLDWKYEKPAGSAGAINIYRNGQRDGWLMERFPNSTEIIFVQSNDPGLKNIIKSDWIQTVRNFSPAFLQTAFKSNEPYIINLPGGATMNLTALADRVQSAFDWIGIIAPPIDVVNALWYTGRGRYFEAVISLIGLIPGVGDAIMLILRPFGRMARSVGGFSKLMWTKLFKSLSGHGLAPPMIVSFASKSSAMVNTMRKSGLITQAQANEMLLWLKTWKDEFALYIKDLAGIEAAAALKQRIAKRIGIEAVGEFGEIAAKKGNWGSALAKTGKILTNIPVIGPLLKYAGRVTKSVMSGAAQLGWSWLFKRSKTYWKAAYTIASNQFRKTLLNDPTKLALCINTFVDKTITKEIYEKLAREFVAKLTPLRGSGKYIWKDGATIIGEFTEAQILTLFIKNPTNMINAYVKKVGAQGYQLIVDFIVTKAIPPGNIVNRYWTAFWTDPLRRFANEYFGKGGFSAARMATGIADTATGRVQNWASDIVSGFTTFFTSNDALKRFDIVYNELQEYFERTDYGEEVGGELNQQSVIYALVNEVFEAIYGKPFTEFLDDGEEAIMDIAPAFKELELRDGADVFPQRPDSLAFQTFDTRSKGGLDYKRAWMQSLIKNKIVAYNGGNTSQWTVLKDAPWIAINYNKGPIKKGQVIEINTQTGIMDIVTNPKLIKRETSPMKQWYDLADKISGKK